MYFGMLHIDYTGVWRCGLLLLNFQTDVILAYKQPNCLPSSTKTTIHEVSNGNGNGKSRWRNKDVNSQKNCKNNLISVYLEYHNILRTVLIVAGSTPLRSRNLPASFFDSSPTIHQPQNQQYTCPGSYTLPYHHSYSSTSNTYNYGDPYYSSSFPTSFHQGATDSWHYAFNTASAAAHRTAAMQMAADFTAANRFSSSYNSLLFPPSSTIRSSRLENPVSQCKNESPWTSATHSVFGTEVPHYGSMSSTGVNPYTLRPILKQNV